MKSLPMAFAAALISGTTAAADTSVTIYRSDSDSLFSPGSQPIGEGHAIVHERRQLTLQKAGRQDMTLDGLPTMLDTEAVALDFGGAARVLGQRVISPGDVGLLGAHRGERVVVSGDNGAALAEGQLVAIDGESIGVRGANGRVTYLRNFARVEFPDSTGLPGSTLQVSLDVASAGTKPATLTYPTSGLGWRAAYAALLDDSGSACKLHLDALASIANRSGRDYAGSTIKLIAGEPNLGSRADYAPRAMMMKAAAAPAPAAPPEQSSLGDYRSYLIDGAIDLPDASVTQVPLYASRDLDCRRRWIAEYGGSWFPSRPNVDNGGSNFGATPIVSQLLFTAPENLPAGNVRVLTRDKDGQTELLGEVRSNDTPKGHDVTLNLGVAFGLRADKERTAFSVDRAARTMNEGFRITFENTSETARTITVREHPNRWRAWDVDSSSQKPSRKTPDVLEFTVDVPAKGKATLDYLLRYSWTATDENG